MIAGELADRRAPPPPPHSWAVHTESHVAIWQISMQPGARWQLPAAPPGARRVLYYFRGSELRVAGEAVPVQRAISLANGAAVELEGGERASELLLLQGRPIGEPVVQYGPFVMNSRQEIQQAVLDYQRTSFGGWPWPSDGPVHERNAGRFAKHVDGRIERPG